MSSKKHKIFTDYGRTVTVGDTLHMVWANGRQEDLVVAAFSQISNEPISTSGQVIFLAYVDWDKSRLQN